MQQKDFEESNQYSRKQNIIVEYLPTLPNKVSTNLAIQVLNKIAQYLLGDTEASHKLPPSRPKMVKMFDWKAAKANIRHLSRVQNVS